MPRLRFSLALLATIGSLFAIWQQTEHPNHFNFGRLWRRCSGLHTTSDCFDALIELALLDRSEVETAR